MVAEATMRAHRMTCPKNPTECGGPSEVELLLMASVVDSTLPAILEAISLEFRQVLHAMAAGRPEIGESDAQAENAEQLLADWFRWWRDSDAPGKLPDALQVRTAAYLTVRAVAQGQPVRGPGDL